MYHVILIIVARIEILGALATGLVVISSKKNLIGHVMWWIIGVASALSFSYHSFAGGCVLALFSVSLWPYLLELLLHHPSSLVLSVGMATYFMLTSASALVSGHDDIPGLSSLLYGRPIIFLIISISLIVMGVNWFSSSNPSIAARLRHRRSSSRSSQVSFFGSVWRRLSTIEEESSSEEISDDDDAFENENPAIKIGLKPDIPALKHEETKRFLSITQKGLEFIILPWLT